MAVGVVAVCILRQAVEIRSSVPTCWDYTQPAPVFTVAGVRRTYKYSSLLSALGVQPPTADRQAVGAK